MQWCLLLFFHFQNTVKYRVHVYKNVHFWGPKVWICMLFSIVHNLQLELFYGGYCTVAATTIIFLHFSLVCWLHCYYIELAFLYYCVSFTLLYYSLNFGCNCGPYRGLRVSQLDGQGPVSKVLQSRTVVSSCKTMPLKLLPLLCQCHPKHHIS